jgi:acylphosphatase
VSSVLDRTVEITLDEAGVMARRVLYSGTVQGVGFRATAASTARGYAVHGWVRNLPDGRVELVVNGAEEVVEAFLADLRDRMAHCITGEDAEEFEPEERLEGFRITD